MTEELSKQNTEEDSEIEVSYSDYQSVKHFCILNLFSLGLYSFFWFYKHWQFLRDEKKFDINASFRTTLTLFYGYSLFKNFYILAIEKGYKRKPAFGILFIFYIIVIILSRIPENFWGLLSIFSFLLLIPVHKMINFYYLNEQVNFRIRVKLGKGEKIFLTVFWSIVILISINYN